MANTTVDQSKAKTEIKILSLKEQTDLVQEEIKKFVLLAKAKGALTVEELNEMLAPEILAPEAIDAMMQALEVNNVKISDLNLTSEDGEEGSDEFKLDAHDQEEDEKDVDQEDLRGIDPVRLYLRKMGSVSLLTREGEVEIARKIEFGEREIVRAMLLSPIGTHEIIQLGQRLDAGRIKVKAIFRGLEDEETKYEEKEYIEKIHQLIAEVKKYQKKAEKAFNALKDDKIAESERQKNHAELEQHNKILMDSFEDINFNRKTIDRIVIKFKNLMGRINMLRRRAKDSVERTFSKDVKSMIERFEKIKADDKELNKMSRDTGLSFETFKGYVVSSVESQ
ncbi:MAG: RNA polymerase sigma factor RpoD, partial [Bdellovibrionales bacterium]|nr:RNA polymerase sigma factor RpoD [Bdellovibrionales bacterium]